MTYEKTSFVTSEGEEFGLEGLRPKNRQKRKRTLQGQGWAFTKTTEKTASSGGQND